jgi:alkylated DNA repair dioxygenase AlkB
MNSTSPNESQIVFQGTRDAALIVREGDSTLAKLVKEALADVEPYLNTPTLVHVFGKTYEEPRRVCMIGADYTYAKSKKIGIPMTPSVAALLEKVNTDFGLQASPVNAVLINKYRNGKDCIGEHADDEKELVDGDVISLSVGAARKFNVKTKKTKDSPKAKLVCSLHTGPLQYLHMRGKDFQKNYVHGIPREPKVEGVRYSFTFRRHLK